MSAFVECKANGQVLGSMEEGEVEHHQAYNREHDPGYDEMDSCAWARWPAFIGIRVHCGSLHCSTPACKPDSSHIACEFRHPIQLLDEWEFAWGGFGFGRETRPSESVRKLGAGERHVNGYEQEYTIAAAEDVVFSGAL